MNSDDQEQVRSANGRSMTFMTASDAENKTEQAIASHRWCHNGANLSVGFASFYVILRTYVERLLAFILDRSIVKSIQLDPLLIILPIWYKVLSISSQYLSLYVIVVLL